MEQYDIMDHQPPLAIINRWRQIAEVNPRKNQHHRMAEEQHQEVATNQPHQKVGHIPDHHIQHLQHQHLHAKVIVQAIREEEAEEVQVQLIKAQMAVQ